MKKLILIFLVFIPTIMLAQSTVSITLQPIDYGYGVRYDKGFDDVGVYSSLSKGNYILTDDCYIKDHYKFAVGITTVPKDGYSFFSIGFSTHYYGEVNLEYLPYQLNSAVLNTFSFELGAGHRIGRMMMAFRMDFIKGESNIDIGYNF